jgi:hypothetical protein
VTDLVKSEVCFFFTDRDRVMEEAVCAIRIPQPKADIGAGNGILISS